MSALIYKFLSSLGKILSHISISFFIIFLLVSYFCYSIYKHAQIFQEDVKNKAREEKENLKSSSENEAETQLVFFTQKGLRPFLKQHQNKIKIEAKTTHKRTILWALISQISLAQIYADIFNIAERLQRNYPLGYIFGFSRSYYSFHNVPISRNKSNFLLGIYKEIFLNHHPLLGQSWKLWESNDLRFYSGYEAGQRECQALIDFNRRPIELLTYLYENMSLREKFNFHFNIYPDFKKHLICEICNKEKNDIQATDKQFYFFCTNCRV